MRRVRREPESASWKTVKLALGVVAAIALLALAWLALRDDDAPPPAKPAAVARQSPMHASAAPASAGSAASPRSANMVAHVADDPRCVIKQPAAPAQADASADPSSPSPTPVVDPRAQASRARLLARLSGSPDPYANAVAVWLDVDVDSDEAHLAERQRRLAAMAASTRDPLLYALALRTCWRRTDHECPSLSARRWSELDPGNAMPWLMMLDEAAAKQDVSGMQEAMFHVSHAETLAERPLAPLQAIVDAATDDPESLVAARAAAVDAIGIAAAQIGPIGYTACAHATPANANVWQQCVAMVDLLEHRSDTLMARGVGTSIDRRLTGNVEPGKQLSVQRGHLLALQLASTSSCDDLRAELSIIRRLGVDGEVAVAQDLAR